MNESFTMLLSQHEASIRISVFFAFLTLMAILEHFIPRRKPRLSKFKRWLNNLGLTFLNTLLLRFILPAGAVGVAAYAAEQNYGLFNTVSTNSVLAICVSILLLDLIIYLQHVMMHALPLFWRLHRVHHADLDYDVTTGARFHPIEILISMSIKLTAIMMLGAPVVAVISFELILSTMAMFNHGNISLGTHLDKALRYFIVTPDMHRIHHSAIVTETNSNFGFNLSWWDKIFGTYQHHAKLAQTDIDIGIHEFEDATHTMSISAMLKIPFLKTTNDYSINSSKKNF